MAVPLLLHTCMYLEQVQEQHEQHIRVRPRPEEHDVRAVQHRHRHRVRLFQVSELSLLILEYKSLEISLH